MRLHTRALTPSFLQYCSSWLSAGRQPSPNAVPSHVLGVRGLLMHADLIDETAEVPANATNRHFPHCLGPAWRLPASSHTACLQPPVAC